MKRLLTLTTLIAAMLATPVLQGCKHGPETTAYRVVGSTITLVDGAMNGWGDFVRAGKASVEQEARVKFAYEKYQASMRAVQMSVDLYRASKDSPQGQAALNNAIAALENNKAALIGLIQTFTAKR